MVTVDIVKADQTIRTYIESADRVLGVRGYTDHSTGHTTKCAEGVREILSKLGYSEREVELGQIAGYMHDIGNVVNRHGHAHTGALIAMRQLERLGMDPGEIGIVTAAIGHHDEETSFPVNAVAAALILSDKSDVRRSRVRNQDHDTFDIHDRVNYAATHSSLNVAVEERTITLDICIDTEISSVMEYFEIFIKRMQICRCAANFLGYQFKLMINATSLI